MGKLIVLFVLIFLSALGVLSVLNWDTTFSLTVWQDIVLKDIPLVAIILISTAIGFFSMLIVVAVRDTKRYIDNWHLLKSNKKEHKIEENYTKGLNAFHASRFDEAVELLKRVIDEEPKHVKAFLRLGDISFNKGDIVEARGYYAKAETVKPRDIKVLLSLEKTFEQDGQWQEALQCLNRILEIDEGNLLALMKKRDIFENSRRWEDLIDVQGEILKENMPEDDAVIEEKRLIGYRYELGQQQVDDGETEKAIKTLRSIIKADSGFVAAYIALADAFLYENKADDAREILVKGYETTSSLVFLVKLEDIYLSEGEPGKIIDFYLKAVEKNRTDPKLQFFLAKLYNRLEMIDDALETLTSLDVSAFDSSDIHVLLGNIYERRAQYDMAAEEFSKALKVEEPLVIPFCCSKCSHTSKEWVGRCPECKNWNGLVFDLNGTCKA